MTNEKLELIKEVGELARRFDEIYEEHVGVISIDRRADYPIVHLRVGTFMELFGNDCEIGWFDGDGDEHYRRHIEDGVIYYTLLDDYELKELKQNGGKHFCRRCGSYCVELYDGYCDICYGDMFGEEQK